MRNENHAWSLGRRQLLKSAGAVTLMAGASPLLAGVVHSAASQGQSSSDDSQIREIVSCLLFSRKEVDNLLLGGATDYIARKYDPDLGYVFSNCKFRHGVDHSVCTYTYDSLGARLTAKYADLPCRIHSYGNSFTHGDQVNDAETWQEQLAAHFGEPIRNFGVGDYSVYQAYLRMKREETRNPGKVIIFTIYDDDHRRSLAAVIPGWAPRPYLTVDVDTGSCEEHSNPCPTPGSLYQLCDFDWVYAQFHEQCRVALRKYWLGAKTIAEISSLVREEGLTPQGASAKEVESLLVRDALFGSKRVVEKIEMFAKAQGKQVLYVLAYGTRRMRQSLEEGYRFDEEFVAFLRQQRVPFVDMMQVHTADAANFKGPLTDYLKRYYVNGKGHYSPAGNLFLAFAIKNQLLELLDPQPPAYATTS